MKNLVMLATAFAFLIGTASVNANDFTAENSAYTMQDEKVAIEQNAVPAAVSDSFENNGYTSDMVQGIYMGKDADGVFYEYVVLVDGEQWSLQFDPEGNSLSKTKMG